MVDIGSGPALVLIPGLQGRWRWMEPTVRALAKHFRVICFSLAGEPDSDRPFDSDVEFDGFVAQIDAVLERKQIESAIICGVSFGGFIALRYAAGRRDRTRALVLVSTPGPYWKPSPTAQRCMDHPRLRFPQFCLDAGRRAWAELCQTFPDWKERTSAAMRYTGVMLAARATPSRMGGRARMAVRADFEQDCPHVKAPTLVITGEAGWDRVVPTETTLEYVRLIKGARVATLEQTGHLGVITRPERFAEIVADFALSQHLKTPRGPSEHASRRTEDREVPPAGVGMSSS